MNKKSKLKNTVLLLLLILIVFILFKTIFKPVEELTEQDKKEILVMTKQYYEDIVKGRFELALSNCYLEGSNIEFKSRVFGLEHLMKDVIEEIEVANNNPRFEYHDDVRSHAIVYSLLLKYKDTSKVACSEVVFVKKIDGDWKITKIWGLDIFGYYRVNEYQCNMLIHSSDKK